jgi:GT2 family glycosyltransferase
LSAPKPGELDWVSGANLVASKRFLQAVGLMREDYFLYFEEVDWAFRRGDLPIVFLTDAVVYHHGGTAIGSGSMMQRASAFSEYLNYRNRIRFSRRFLGRPPLGAYLYGLAKAAQSLLRGEVEQATAIVAGVLELRPPRPVASRIDDPEVAALAFGPGES